MAETFHKPEMIAHIQQSYAAFEAGLASLDARQMTAPTLPGGWAVKDTLAHLTIWHRRALDLIAPIVPPRVPDIPASGIPDDQIDQFNGRFYAEHKGQPLPEVLTAFRESYRQLLETVQRLPEADLLKSLGDDTRIWHFIAGNTYYHYPEHLSAIHAAFPGA